eukprot:scaffold10_cov257-Pinguiococcus_pyrenoidosus.AAC.23
MRRISLGPLGSGPGDTVRRTRQTFPLSCKPLSPATALHYAGPAPHHCTARLTLTEPLGAQEDVGGHDKGRGRGIAFPDDFQRFDAVQVRHVEVRDDQGELGLLAVFGCERLVRLDHGEARRDAHAVQERSQILEHLRQHQQVRAVVVRDQDDRPILGKRGLHLRGLDHRRRDLQLGLLLGGRTR